MLHSMGRKVLDTTEQLVVLFLVFLKEFPLCFPQWLHQFIFPWAVQRISLFSSLSPALVVCGFFDDGHFDQCEMISNCSFELHFSHNVQC